MFLTLIFRLFLSDLQFNIPGCLLVTHPIITQVPSTQCKYTATMYINFKFYMTKTLMTSLLSSECSYREKISSSIPSFQFDTHICFQNIKTEKSGITIAYRERRYVIDTVFTDHNCVFHCAGSSIVVKDLIRQSYMSWLDR